MASRFHLLTYINPHSALMLTLYSLAFRLRRRISSTSARGGVSCIKPDDGAWGSDCEGCCGASMFKTLGVLGEDSELRNRDSRCLDTRLNST
jgi:hypothetical protein